MKYKDLFFRSTNFINKTISLPYLIKKSGVKIIFPFYHVVSDEDLPHIKHLYPYKNVEGFKNDLDFLLKYFKPLHIDDYLRNNYDTNENYFVLSFDDGLKEMYEVVAPILKEKNITAVFFINSAFANNAELFYRHRVSLQDEQEKNDLTDKDFLEKQKPYMTTEQIKELSEQGFSIGAHSHDHPFYSEIRLDEQIEQTKKSLEYLKSNFHPSHNYFAFPFTSDEVSDNFFDKMYDDLKVDISFGTAGMKKQKRQKHIERIPMEVKKYSAAEIIKNEYVYFLVKGLFGKR